MPNTCSNEQRLHLLHVMRVADGADVTSPGDAGGGVGQHALGSPGDGAGDAELQWRPQRRPLGLHGCPDVLSGDEEGESAAPKAAGGEDRRDEVDVCGSPLRAPQRHKNLLSRGLLGSDCGPRPAVMPGVPSAPPLAQEAMASESTLAATTTRSPVSPAPSPSLLAEGKPDSSILVSTSRSSNSASAAAAAGGGRTDLFSAAADDSGAASCGNSVDVARTCAGTGVEGVYGRHYVSPMLQSRSGRRGRSSRFFNRGADGDDDDEDGSVALQAAVDAAVRFDDLASEDDARGGGGERRRLLRADITPLSHLFAAANDSDDSSFTRTHSVKADFVSPFSMPGRRSDGHSERSQLYSPLAPDTQQRGRGGERDTGGRPQMLNRVSFLGNTYPPLSSVAPGQRVATGAEDATCAVTASSLPYFSAPDGTIVPPLQSAQPRASSAAAAATSTTATATAGKPSYAATQAHQQRQQRLYPYAVASASILTSSLTSPHHSSMSMSSSMNGVQQLHQQQPQSRRHHHRQCSSLLHSSPHGSKTPPATVMHPFPAGATAIATLCDTDGFRYVSPPQASVAVTRRDPSVSGASMGGSAAAQNSPDASVAAVPGAADSGTGAGVRAQTPNNSLLSSPGAQPFHLYQLPQATAGAEPQQQYQRQGSANVLLYSPPQAYLGSGQMALANLRPAPSSPASAAAALGDATRERSTSPLNGSYRLPAVTQQQQQLQVIGGYTLTPSANAAAAAAAAAAAPSDESGRASRNLYIKNLPHSWNTTMLRELCSRYGTVLSAKVAHHSTTNESLGYGFVLFEHKQSAVTCMAMLNQAHVRTEGGEPRMLLVRMAHATAAPGFQEEGVSESAASSLRKPLESPTSGSAGGRLPQWVLQQQQQTASRLHSPRTLLSDSASKRLQLLGSAVQFHSRELSGVGMGDIHRGQAHHHLLGGSMQADAKASSNTSGAGGDSLRCTSPVGGAGSSSSVAISRTSVPPSFLDACGYTSPKGAAKASVPPLLGLYRVSSANATPSPLSPNPTHSLQVLHQQQQQQQEGPLSYSSASATMPVPAGTTVTASAMTAATAQRAGYSFSSPLSLSPSDTASLLLLSPSVSHPPVQLPQSFHAPSAPVPVSASSTKLVPSGTASAPTSTRNVYITNLPLTWNTAKLRELCSQCGEIVSASVAHHPKTNESRGYGFALFLDERDAASCVMTLHQYRVPNSPNVLSCRFAKEKATPSIAHTLLPPSHERGLDSLGRGSSGPLLATTAGGLPAAATLQTTVPMIAMGDNAEVFDGSGFSSGHDSGTDGSVKDAVCMPIDVFCTLQQRVRAQCAQFLAQQQQQTYRKILSDGSETISAAAMAEVPSEELEKMLRYCVVYGAHVPAEGCGCVRPVNCLSPSFLSAVTQLPTAVEVDDAAPLLGGPPAEPSTPASSGRRSVSSALSAERGDPRGEIAGAPDIAAPTSRAEAVVCTHAISLGRAQPAFPALAVATTRQAASSRGRSISVEPRPHGVGMAGTESVKRMAAPEVMASPVIPSELWYTCTLFTTQSASEAFVREAAEAALGAGATIDIERGDSGTSGGSAAGTLAMQLSFSDKDSLPAAASSETPACDKATNAPQTRFGLRDQVMVFSSALSAVPATAAIADSTRQRTPEETHSQQRPPMTPSQQQHHSQDQYRRQPHVWPPSTLPYRQARDVNAAASATQPGASSLFFEAGLAAPPAHPLTFTSERAQQLPQPPHQPKQQQQQPILCSPSSADTLLRSPPSQVAHCTCPLTGFASPTARASLTSPTSMILTGGGGDGGSNSAAAPMSFSPDLASSASTSAADWHPPATAADRAYLLGSSASSASISLSTGTHILSGSATPQPRAPLNFPSMPSAYSAVLNAAGPGSPSGSTASAAHTPAAVFATPTAHAWTAFTGGSAAATANVLGSPPPAAPVPSYSSSPGQAPLPPPHLSYPFGGVIYAMPAAALSVPALSRPPVLFSASPATDVADSATLTSSTLVSCTSLNATPQRFTQQLHPLATQASATARARTAVPAAAASAQPLRRPCLPPSSP
ncbi:hypothetical protein JIQ42_07776 [Leishmania sp. Namibia]|uniref:hypothetical protein n=1 Tax=Leishmania sp. Namibia TaxID=2802991 RepID=UPI001B548606|nr:hypothetical protein JIQ42_07776 [Leishmania sp. Namibia]